MSSDSNLNNHLKWSIFCNIAKPRGSYFVIPEALLNSDQEMSHILSRVCRFDAQFQFIFSRSGEEIS